MNWVAPIKEKESLKRFLKELKTIDEKYYILFQIGLGTGMLLQDILKLKVGDVKDQDCLEVWIGSRRIRRVFSFSEELKEEIEAFTNERDPKEPLILGHHNSKTALSREQAYRVFKEAGSRVGLQSIGAQTMRKTFAWNYYKETGDIHYIQKLLNHASSAITYQYIGEPKKAGEEGKLTEEECARIRRQLLRDGIGRQRIEKIKSFLTYVEKNLGNPEKQDSYFGKTECLLSGMESLMAEFKKSVRKGKNKF